MSAGPPNRSQPGLAANATTTSPDRGPIHVAPSGALSLFAGLAALGAVGLTLALVGIGLPFLAAASLSAVAAGVAHYTLNTVLTRATQPAPPAPHLPTPDPARAPDLEAQLESYRAHASALRHDLRGVLSPALMMSDRLLNHADPAVQRAGTAVVRSIDRATALLGDDRKIMAALASPESKSLEQTSPEPTRPEPTGPAPTGPLPP